MGGLNLYKFEIEENTFVACFGVGNSFGKYDESAKVCCVGGYPEGETEDVNAVLITKKGFRLESFIK